MWQNMTTEYEQASCAMFAVLCKWRIFNLPVDFTPDLLVSYTKVWGGCDNRCGGKSYALEFLSTFKKLQTTTCINVGAGKEPAPCRSEKENYWIRGEAVWRYRKWTQAKGAKYLLSPHNVGIYASPWVNALALAHTEGWQHQLFETDCWRLEIRLMQKWAQE